MRELSGGIAGFWSYLACLALGAWAIASAGSITDALQAGLTQQSRALLGGDAAIQISQRAATAEERAWLDERGTVSEAAQADLMARNLDDRVELVARVDDEALADELVGIVDVMLADTANAWRLHPDRSWQRVLPPDGEEPFSSQDALMDRSASRPEATPRDDR